MKQIRIMGKKGSHAVKKIIKGTPILRYKGRKGRSDSLINYGLAGKNLENYYNKFPSARKIHTINRRVGYSKYSVVKRVEKKEILVPDTKISLSIKDKKKLWIEKSTRSIGGKGIVKARGKKKVEDKYYQRFIDNRRYELRVHTFLWTKDWDVQKRLGDKQDIAWNYKNGGRFVSIRNTGYNVFQKAIETSREVLNILSMSFGAVDFIVDEDYNLYFIEINSAPGFQELSEDIYIDAFNKLVKMPLKKIKQLK